jgi:hypothetical protein
MEPLQGHTQFWTSKAVVERYATEQVFLRGRCPIVDPTRLKTKMPVVRCNRIVVVGAENRVPVPFQNMPRPSRPCTFVLPSTRDRANDLVDRNESRTFQLRNYTHLRNLKSSLVIVQTPMRGMSLRICNSLDNNNEIRVASPGDRRN